MRSFSFIAGMGFEPHDLRVMRCLFCPRNADSMDFIRVFGFVFADVSPTDDEKRYSKNFHLDYTRETTKQGSTAQGTRGIHGKKRRIHRECVFLLGGG